MINVIKTEIDGEGQGTGTEVNPCPCAHEKTH